MVDKIKAQNETSTSQKFTNLQIVGDLSASTICRGQLLYVVSVSRCLELDSFLSGKNPIPDGVQLQTLVSIEVGIVDGFKGFPTDKLHVQCTPPTALSSTPNLSEPRTS